MGRHHHAEYRFPIYEDFFRIVREVNQTLSPPERFRVLLGDPPIDWTKVSGKDDVLRWMNRRNAFAAELIRKDVLAKHRRALLLYADGHFFRKGEETVPDWYVDKTKPEEPLVSQLEKTNREPSSLSPPQPKPISPSFSPT